MHNALKLDANHTGKEFSSNNILWGSPDPYTSCLYLEPRILLDAALGATMGETGEASGTDMAPDDTITYDDTDGTSNILPVLQPDTRQAENSDDLSVEAASSSPSEIVFVDWNLRDGATIEEILRSRYGNQESNVHVHVLERGDNWEDVVAIAQEFESLSAVHIISHGTQGSLVLGGEIYHPSDWQDKNSVLARTLRQLGQSIQPEGDILLYGCTIGQGAAGQTFIDQLAHVTGRDVAASTDDTGAVNQGGDWDLESRSGSIEAATLRLAEYDSLLNPGTFTFTVGARGITTGTDSPGIKGYQVGKDIPRDHNGRLILGRLAGSDPGSGSLYDYYISRNITQTSNAGMFIVFDPDTQFFVLKYEVNRDIRANKNQPIIVSIMSRSIVGGKTFRQSEQNFRFTIDPQVNTGPPLADGTPDVIFPLKERIIPDGSNGGTLDFIITDSDGDSINPSTVYLGRGTGKIALGGARYVAKDGGLANTYTLILNKAALEQLYSQSQSIARNGNGQSEALITIDGSDSKGTIFSSGETIILPNRAPTVAFSTMEVILDGPNYGTLDFTITDLDGDKIIPGTVYFDSGKGKEVLVGARYDFHPGGPVGAYTMIFNGRALQSLRDSSSKTITIEGQDQHGLAFSSEVELTLSKISPVVASLANLMTKNSDIIKQKDAFEPKDQEAGPQADSGSMENAGPQADSGSMENAGPQADSGSMENAGPQADSGSMENADPSPSQPGGETDIPRQKDGKAVAVMGVRERARLLEIRNAQQPGGGTDIPRQKDGKAVAVMGVRERARLLEIRNAQQPGGGTDIPRQKDGKAVAVMGVRERARLLEIRNAQQPMVPADAPESGSRQRVPDDIDFNLAEREVQDGSPFEVIRWPAELNGKVLNGAYTMAPEHAEFFGIVKDGNQWVLQLKKTLAFKVMPRDNIYVFGAKLSDEKGAVGDHRIVVNLVNTPPTGIDFQMDGGSDMIQQKGSDYILTLPSELGSPVTIGRVIAQDIGDSTMRYRGRMSNGVFDLGNISIDRYSGDVSLSGNIPPGQYSVTIFAQNPYDRVNKVSKVINMQVIHVPSNEVGPLLVADRLVPAAAPESDGKGAKKVNAGTEPGSKNHVLYVSQNHGFNLARHHVRHGIGDRVRGRRGESRSQHGEGVGGYLRAKSSDGQGRHADRLDGLDNHRRIARDQARDRFDQNMDRYNIYNYPFTRGRDHIIELQDIENYISGKLGKDVSIVSIEGLPEDLKHDIEAQVLRGRLQRDATAPVEMVVQDSQGKQSIIHLQIDANEMDVEQLPPELSQGTQGIDPSLNPANPVSPSFSDYIRIARLNYEGSDSDPLMQSLDVEPGREYSNLSFESSQENSDGFESVLFLKGNTVKDLESALAA